MSKTIEDLELEIEQLKAQQETEENAPEYIKQWAKTQLKDREPVTVPKEYLFAGAAGAAVLILTAWPVLILGAVLGAFGAFKLGCPTRRN